MTIAYSSAVFQGTEIKKMQVQKIYLALKNKQKIPQTEYMEALAQDGEQWMNYLDKYSESVQ